MHEMTGTPYQYTFQNPINYTDPTGMMPEGDPTRASTGADDYYYDSDTGTQYQGTTRGNWTYTNSNGDLTVYGNPEYSRSNNSGVTSGGQFYGGDGSGSFMDWVHRVVYETDQYNPIALAWDGIQGYITGADRFGNELNTAGSTMKLAMAIPLAKGAKPLMLAEETFSQALFKESVKNVEKVGVYSIYGTKGLVGNTFNRNIFYIKSADKGLGNFRSLIKSIEQEAIQAKADKISIYGSSIVNDGFLNPQVIKRFGYSFEKSGEGVIMQKTLK